MLETRSLTADVGVGLSKFRDAVLILREQGWAPAILQSELAFLRLAGVDESLPLRPDAAPDGYTGCGELFFRGDDIYYCVCMSGVGRMFSEKRGGEGPAVEAGLITANVGDADKRVRTFASTVEMALRRAIGAKAGELTFDWSASKADRSRLAALEKPEREGQSARFAVPRLDRELVRGAAVLVEPLARQILAEIALAGFVRARDVLAARPDHDAVESALEKLRRAGLVTVEHLLECSKYGTPLTRLAEPSKLQSAEVGALVCPSCGLQFSEEALCEGYSTSDLGQRLERNAHWLTVLIMYKLVELGVPPEFMVWNVSRPGEGVDIAVQFLGQFWVFELKDREFDAHDVLEFNYRRARSRPHKAFIVTTGKVSPEAKHLFEELSSCEPPIFVEGLGKAPDTLKREVRAAELNYACERLRVIEDLTGYDLAGVVAARFKEQVSPRTARGKRETAPSEAAEEQRSADPAAKIRQQAVQQKQ